MQCCGTHVTSVAAISSPSLHPELPCEKPRKPWPGRIATLASWTLSLAPLVLMPKCPACVAAYALLFTGISLSLSTAAAIRWIAIATSLALSGFLLLRAIRQAIRAHHSTA